MGRLDRIDQNISYYRIALWPKKLWMSFFLFIPDAAVQNAWFLCQSFSSHDNKAMNLINFQRKIVNIYRMKFLSRQRSRIFSPGNVRLFRGKSNKRRLRKFFLMVSNITHLAIELNILVFIVVKSQSSFSQNVILDFTLIVFKVIMKM